MKTVRMIVLVFLFNHLFVSIASSNDYKLELLQVLFRHGDRIPGSGEEYETDPYKEMFKEQGYGQLTAKGMRREYETGRYLRNRYDDFLGDYKPDEVYAFSSYYDRTKMSLDLLLAGLYPPPRNVIWNSDIYWTPIPIHYEPRETNILTTNEACSRYPELVKEAEKSQKIQKEMEKFHELPEYIKNKTRIADTRPNSLRKLYYNIEAVLSMELPLPNWCSNDVYKKLKEIASISLDSGVETNLMKRIIVGPMLEEFLNNIQNNENKFSKRKIYLYSGHDNNIAHFERAHNFTNFPKTVDYSSALMIEKLRGPDNRAYIRMLLWAGVIDQLIPLKLENCDNECPLSDYLDIVQQLLPNDEVRKCFPAVTCTSKNSSIL